MSETTIQALVEHSFSQSYEEARSAFRVEARQAGGVLTALPVHGAEATDDEDLTIDAASFGTGPHAVVLSSGLHGVEGFAGSAIQRALIRQGIPEDLRLVLVHALNPYGMSRIRRVNPNNVDLNRNFLAEGEAFEGAPDGYRDNEEMLNPRTPHGASFDPFLLQAVWRIIRFGMPAMKQAVVGGQYDFPQGLFFGGHQLQREAVALQAAYADWVNGCERIVHVDFHTGLGKSGTYALLVEATDEIEEYDRLHATYGDRVQPWDPDQGVAYRITGGFPTAVRRWVGTRADVLTCEFGTHPSLKVLSALRAENRATHWSGDIESAKALLREAFCPDDATWRTQVIQGGLHVVGQAIEAVRTR